jgi:hypothetical protein
MDEVFQMGLRGFTEESLIPLAVDVAPRKSQQLGWLQGRGQFAGH